MDNSWLNVIDIPSIILSVTAIFGVITYFQTSKKNRAAIAMQLVKHYMEMVIPLGSFIMRCTDENDFLNNVISRLEKEKALYFFKSEACEIFSEEEITQYNGLFHGVSIDKIKHIYLANQFQLDFLKGSYETMLKDFEDTHINDEETRTRIIDDFFVRLVARIKNELEYFAMSFIAVGDIKLVYSSIHQTYLQFCRIYYLNCSQHNDCNHEKYYTNMITLYNSWNKKTIWAKRIANRKNVRVQKWLSRQK